jgi:hypothetical protein
MDCHDAQLSLEDLNELHQAARILVSEIDDKTAVNTTLKVAGKTRSFRLTRVKLEEVLNEMWENTMKAVLNATEEAKSIL